MLRTLLRTQPQWTQHDYAEAVGHLLAWVKKWTKRRRAAAVDDVAVLHSHSRARKHCPPKLSQAVIDRLLEIRSAPPAPINRIPGPKTIRYYLEQDSELRPPAAAATLHPHDLADFTPVWPHWGAAPRADPRATSGPAQRVATRFQGRVERAR